MGFVFFLIFGGIMFGIATAHKRHVEGAWGQVASVLGLQLLDPRPESLPF